MRLQIDFSKTSEKQKLFNVLKGLKQERYILTIEKHRDRRTIDQNRYYWVCLGIVASETGNDTDDMHDYFKAKYLDKREVIFKSTGEVSEITGSTSSLDKVMFFKYVESIRNFSLQELNIYIPTPEEYLNNY